MRECWFAYFPAPFLLPSNYGIPCKLLPTLDTMYEGDIGVPPVVHGPVLISFADLNGFEFGTKVRNPYRTLFEREPDDVIANGIAVFRGDFHLPEAAALAPEQHAHEQLKTDPQAALAAARQAVALLPKGFDATWCWATRWRQPATGSARSKRIRRPGAGSRRWRQAPRRSGGRR